MNRDEKSVIYNSSSPTPLIQTRVDSKSSVERNSAQIGILVGQSKIRRLELADHGARDQ